MNKGLFWSAVASLLCAWLVPCHPQESKGVRTVSAGEISGNTYHNAKLGFSYEFPAGWTIGKATVPEHRFGLKDSPSDKKPPKGTPRCSTNLLFVTQHPEGMRPDGFVSMASLFAVDPTCVGGPKFPVSAGDREKTEKTVNTIEALIDTPPLTDSTLPKVHPVEYAGRVFLQISQRISISVHDTSTTTNQNLQVSISAMQAGDYWLIWLFVTANDSEMSTLRATKIFFDDATSPKSGSNKP